jgi:ribosomal protein S17E
MYLKRLENITNGNMGNKEFDWSEKIVDYFANIKSGIIVQRVLRYVTHENNLIVKAEHKVLTKEANE